MEFKIGDIVTLSTGGPPMTVCQIIEATSSRPGELLCTWLDRGRASQEGIFDAKWLEPYQGSH